MSRIASRDRVAPAARSPLLSAPPPTPQRPALASRGGSAARPPHRVAHSTGHRCRHARLHHAQHRSGIGVHTAAAVRVANRDGEAGPLLLTVATTMLTVMMVAPPMMVTPTPAAAAAFARCCTRRRSSSSLWRPPGAITGTCTGASTTPASGSLWSALYRALGQLAKTDPIDAVMLARLGQVMDPDAATPNALHAVLRTTGRVAAVTCERGRDALR